MKAIKTYTDDALLNHVKSLPSFKGIPSGLWILGVRSRADNYDMYDDKFYIFRSTNFVDVMTGTTNSGGYGLLNFAAWNKNGVAHVKSDEWYYNVWNVGKHKNKVKALVQVKPFKIYRDNNKNKQSGDVPEKAWQWEDWIGINFHPNTYNLNSKVITWMIGGWSVGCQVVNDTLKFKKFIENLGDQRQFTYCLIDEF